MNKHFSKNTPGKGQSFKTPRPVKSHSLFLYGIHPCLAAIENKNRIIKRIFTTEKVYQHTLLPCLQKTGRKSIPHSFIEGKDFGKYVSPEAVHQNIVLEVDPLPQLDLEDVSHLQSGKSRLVVLDQVNDPHNVGAILRSCAAFGINGIIVTEHASAALTATLAKSASGALELVPIVSVINLTQAMDKMKEWDFWFMGLDEDGISLQDCSPSIFQGNLGIVLGAEGQGLRRLTKEKCDYMIKLPTSSAFSTLNVSNAAAIILYETWRQREA